VALAIPATHAMNAFNQLAYDASGDVGAITSVIILFAGGVLAYGLAQYLFTWDEKNAGRRATPALAFVALVPYVVAAVLLG